MKLTGESIFKAVIYTTVALIALGLLKVAIPDVWIKIPGLKEF